MCLVGMGIRKMKELRVASGLREPTFVLNGSFRVVFHRSPEFAMKEEPATTEKTRDKILDLVHAASEITTAEMAEKTGLTIWGIDWNIRRLKKAGRLRRIGPAEGGNWETVKD